jgi:hypothetical protein
LLPAAAQHPAQLAHAFTAALNAREIRLWAQQQVQAGIRTVAYDFRVTENGAAWTADVYREDWRAVGVTPLRVTNSIWVHNGQLANFTSKLTGRS